MIENCANQTDEEAFSVFELRLSFKSTPPCARAVVWQM
jgi:hypothetical protein